MKIYNKDNKIIVEFPYQTERFNPYIDGPVGLMNTLTGLITHTSVPYSDMEQLQMGWGYTIDMSYKGKDDQVSDFVIIYTETTCPSDDSANQEIKEFRKLNRKLGLSIVETYEKE